MSEENENKTPVADEVAGRIKEILFSGELSHGQKLPGENKIAERLGVGRSSVREALKQLAAAGYVELVPNRGAFAVVTSSDEMPSPRDGAVRWLSVNRSSVDELLRVRSCIEPFAAELCAGRADKELCAALAENLSDFEKASADPVKTAENAEEKDVAKEESAKDGAKKRHNGRRNHKPSPMETDPTFVPRDARYFCHDVRGEAP